MIIRKAYKYRLKVDSELEQQLARVAGCCRFVWNRALDLQKQLLSAGLSILSYADLCIGLSYWKSIPEFHFLKETHSQLLQQKLKDLDRAIKEAFAKKKGFPHFKKKFYGDSFRYPQGCKIEGNRIFLPKLGWISFFHSVNPKGDIKNVNVSKKGDHWYIAVQTEYEVEEPQHSSQSEVGVDLGISRFATLSNGFFFEPLNSFRKLEKKLSSEQRKLSRKIKFSANWKNQKRRINRIHIKIADTRRDYQHKISTQISKNHAVIVLEDLNINQMSQSARGDLDFPGKNVRKKSSLNKSILDQGWYEFRRQLEYKQTWNGGKVIVVPPQLSNVMKNDPLDDHKV